MRGLNGSGMIAEQDRASLSLELVSSAPTSHEITVDLLKRILGVTANVPVYSLKNGSLSTIQVVNFLNVAS